MTAKVTSTSSSSVDKAINDMKKAFDEAIVTNSKITKLKTEKGSVETVAQQRPNIG